MTPTKYLTQSKDLIDKVIKHRKDLDRVPCGFVPKAVRAEIPNIENAMSRIKTAPKMKEFLQRKMAAIHFLIPSIKHEWTKEFNSLLNTVIKNSNE